MIRTIKHLTHNVYLLMAVFMLLFGAANYVYAATHAFEGRGGSGAGYAWSSNTGWMQFNGVRYDDVSHRITGYAWSSNIGWVRFGQFQNCPTGNNSATCGSRVDYSNPANPQVRGWARVCSVAGSSCSLSGTSQNPAAGGWDGWISLHCENENGANCGAGGSSNYGWNVASNGDINGYAWGGFVNGWIQAADLNIGRSAVPPSPTLTFEVYDRNTNAAIPNNALVAHNAQIGVRWNINPSHNSTTCVAEGFSLPGNMVAPPASDYARTGNRNLSTPGAGQTRTYALRCSNETGTSVRIARTIRVPSPPSLSFEATLNGEPVTYPPNLVVALGDTLQFTWNSTSVSGDSLSCQTVGGPGFSTGSGNPRSGTVTADLPPMASAATYRIRCDGLGGPTFREITVEHPAPDVELTVTPNFVNRGEDVEATWDIIGRTPGNCTLAGAGIPGSPQTLSAINGTVSNITIEGETDITLSCAAEGITDGDTEVVKVKVTGEIIEN